MQRGLKGGRGLEWLKFCTIARILKPAFIIGENVAGLVHHMSGASVSVFYRAMALAGYGRVWPRTDNQKIVLPTWRSRWAAIFIHDSLPPIPESISSLALEALKTYRPLKTLEAAH